MRRDDLKRISHYIGVLFLSAFLVTGGILFGALYLNLVEDRSDEVMLGLLNRGDTHRDVLEQSFTEQTIHHVSLMESTSEFTVVVTDQYGQIKSTSDRLTDEMRQKLVHTDFTYQQNSRIVNPSETKGHYLMTDSPITVSGKHVGHVFMFAQADLVQRVVDPLTRQFIRMGIVALVLTVFVVWFFTRVISRPLIEMERATAELGRGNLSADLPVERQDELGALARSITKLAKDLDLLNRERTEFLANVSHELRTPLTYMKGYADILSRPGLTESEKASYIKIIQEESTQVTELIEQLLLLARLDENEFLIKRLPVSLEQLIPSLVEKVRPAIEAEGLTLTVMGDAVMIEGDDVRLGQVVLNLLDNARKYTETGSIEINYGRNSGGPFFAVRDTGIGIEENEIKRVTERLYRSEPSRSRNRGGSGIGLAIASAIVKAHGASLEIKSRKNQGTTVTVQWEV